VLRRPIAITAVTGKVNFGQKAHVRLCDYTGKWTEEVATSHKALLTRNDFWLARDSHIIGASHDFQREFRINFDFDSDCFAAVLLPGVAPGPAIHNCSESENIQHAIGADSNQLVSIHAEGDRVCPDAPPRLEIPQRFSCLVVECVEVSLVGAGKYQASSS
jgi:hypothetical protein